ncbi:mitochondrial proton/calcium exchanger protein-like protein isoform X1, partial [Tanacetum coccineum]
MTRSSTSELFTPYKEPEREFRSYRRHFKTLSLDALRSPDFNLFSDQEYSEEEEAETMAETMEQYMSKTRADYGSGVSRPKIKDKDNFELTGQFLKELRTNTFSGSDHEDAKEHIKKVLKIVDLFHIPNITIDQVMLRAFLISLTGTASRWLRNEPTGGGYRAAASGFYQRNNVNPLYQERRQSIEDTLSKFKSESAKRHEENSNLNKEIQASTDAAIRNQGASIQTLEIQIGQMSKILQERGFGILPSSTEANPRDQVKSISTTIEAYSYPIRRIGSSQYAVSTGQNRTLIRDHMDHNSRKLTLKLHISIPRKEKDPGSFTLPCFINNVCFDSALVDLGASVSVMPLSTYLNLGLGELAHTKLTIELADRTVKYPKGIAENVLITLRVREERIVFTSVKLTSSLIKRVYMLSLRERMELDLEARLMGETLVLNRSLDLFFEDYIELNDLNEPFELKRNQGDDLIPTIEEGEVIEEFRTRDDELDARIDDYPSYCDYDKKIHID